MFSVFVHPLRDSLCIYKQIHLYIFCLFYVNSKIFFSILFYFIYSKILNTLILCFDVLATVFWLFLFEVYCCAILYKLQAYNIVIHSF